MKDLGGKRSEEGGHRETSRCPVQHSTSSTSSSREGEGSAEAVLSSVSQGSVNPSVGSSGFWSRIATFIPFRSNINKTVATRKDKNGAIGTASGDTITGGERGCPVGTRSSLNDSPASSPLDPSAPIESSSGCPVQHNPANPAKRGLAALLTGESGLGGAVEEGGEPAYNAMNSEYVYGQEEYPGQEMPLSSQRQRSSIPKADYNPSHQPKEEVQTWVYPSEQQYYNAIKRKGYKTSATDMPSTLVIHNAVNEKGWEMVKEWERERTAAKTARDHATIVEEEVADLRLLRFSGRPQDISPKAWINTYLLGYRPPFDRHDWIVKRSDGTEARYVIDFYSGKAPPGSNIPVAMHLDVRPALDSFDAVFDRTRMFFMKEVSPYLSRISNRFRNDSGSSSSGTSEEDAPPPAAR